jgi:uncharacterized lipoprotein YajG
MRVSADCLLWRLTALPAALLLTGCPVRPQVAPVAPPAAPAAALASPTTSRVLNRC